MGLFGSFFRTPDGNPPKTTSVQDSLRDGLFGDRPLDQWPGPGAETTDAFPWSEFVTARQRLDAGRVDGAKTAWRQVLLHDGLESRHYLQAWHFLRQHGTPPGAHQAKDVLGVVVEIGLPQGLDVFAAYADHSARYLNHAGGAVVWEHPDSSLDAGIDELLAAGRDIVAQIPPWGRPRPQRPATGVLRLSFLTPGGLSMGQGPLDEFPKHAFAGRVFQSATLLLQELTAKSPRR
jgi:hypothetical protein